MVWYQMFVVCKNGTIFSSYRYAAYFATIPQISAIIQLWIWCLFPSILFRVCYVLFIFKTVVAIYLLIHHRHQQTFRNIESAHQGNPFTRIWFSCRTNTHCFTGIVYQKRRSSYRFQHHSIQTFSFILECLKKNCQNRILHNKKKNTKKKLLDTKSLNISGVKKKSHQNRIQTRKFLLF